MDTKSGHFVRSAADQWARFYLHNAPAGVMALIANAVAYEQSLGPLVWVVGSEVTTAYIFELACDVSGSKVNGADRNVVTFQ